jgi:stress-induced morphogen
VQGPGGPTNFDTLKVVQRLEAQGFTAEQSRAVMELLKDVIDESVMGLTRTMVTREEQDKVSLLLY